LSATQKDQKVTGTDKPDLVLYPHASAFRGRTSRVSRQSRISQRTRL